jgi:Protein of unknown function (DUF3788)
MPSIFLDKSVKPNDAMLSHALGRSYKYWEEIKTSLCSQYGPLTEEWKFYGANSGWTLKLLRKKRNLFFLAPCEKYFRIAFIFGEKAVHEVEASTLPPTMIQELKNAKRYVEGRGLRLEVRRKADVKNIVTLTAIKVNN